MVKTLKATLAGLLLLGVGIGIGLNGSRWIGGGLSPDVNLAGLNALDPTPASRAQAVMPVKAPVVAGTSNRHTRVVDVAQSASPAVVSIGVSKIATVQNPIDMFDPSFTIYRLAQRELDFPYLGSGFIIDQDGHVITNYHVVQDAKSITVTLTDNRSYPARLLDADRFVDIALLKIDPKPGDPPLPTIPMGNSDDIMIGETVIAIGNPFGPLIADPRPSVSVGVVSAVKRSFDADRRDGEARAYQDMIQSDAAINPGNSGGPLVNLDGEVIGINTFIFSRSGDSASVGFSIPINRARKVEQEIMKFGKIRALSIDFQVKDITPYVQQVLHLSTTKGALVTSINGPAEKAGLQPGDVITKVDDKHINSAQDLMTNLLTRTVGETLKIQIQRQDQELEIKYTMIEGGEQE
jgi:serine protease Do